MIDVILLGTGGMTPLPGRWLSSALIRSEGSLVLLDCGEGTQVAMRERGWGFRRLNALCLSHMHADHVAGVPGLLHTVANAGKTSPLTIYGPAGTKKVIEGLRTIASILPYEVIVRELEPGDEVDGPGALRIRVAAGEHRVPVHGYRFERLRAPKFDVEGARALGIPLEGWAALQRGEDVEAGGRVFRPSMVIGEQRPGVALGFATDTRPTDALRELVSGVDLLIAEGTYGDDDDRDKAITHRHMTFRESARFAAEANAGHLWLTHFSSSIRDPEDWRSNATEAFPQVTIGRAGLEGRLRFDTGYEEIPPSKVLASENAHAEHSP
jgi:ribonuclease Z